jgi:hypothetical protein
LCRGYFFDLIFFFHPHFSSHSLSFILYLFLYVCVRGACMCTWGTTSFGVATTSKDSVKNVQCVGPYYPLSRSLKLLASFDWSLTKGVEFHVLKINEYFDTTMLKLKFAYNIWHVNIYPKHQYFNHSNKMKFDMFMQNCDWLDEM